MKRIRFIGDGQGTLWDLEGVEKPAYDRGRPRRRSLLIPIGIVLVCIAGLCCWILSSRGGDESEPPAVQTPHRSLQASFASVLPDARRLISVWFRQKGLPVLPQSAGDDEGDLERISPVVITKLSGMRRVVSWHSHRFRGDGGGVSLFHLSSHDTNLAKDGTVRFNAGTVRIDAERFPPDGKWHVFCLSADDPLGTTEEEREIFCVQKNLAETVGARSHPVASVLHGCVAEGWVDAVEAGWNEDQLRCLVFMACGQTQLLAQKKEAAIVGSLRDSRYAFLSRDLTAAAAFLDARKQALLQRLPSTP